MQTTTEIRRRPDGSLDLEHYAEVGRDLRATTLREICSAGLLGLLLKQLKRSGRVGAIVPTSLGPSA